MGESRLGPPSRGWWEEARPRRARRTFYSRIVGTRGEKGGKGRAFGGVLGRAKLCRRSLELGTLDPRCEGAEE